MGKIVRVGSRGTSRRVTSKETDDWAGEDYKKIMKERKEEAGNMFVTVGRGTRKIKFSDIKETAGSPSAKGRYVSTGRGTGRRKVA